MSEGSARQESLGILGSIKAFLGTFVALAHNRFELLSVEVEEELARLVRVLVWSIAAMLCAVVGLTFTAVLVLLSVGPQARPFTAGILAAVFVLAALGCSVWARSVLHAKRRPFDASLTELESDFEELRGDR